jgi:predicted transglutaminase-like cysteine proteinase
MSLLLLAAALCFPSDFSAMGTGGAPVHDQPAQTRHAQADTNAGTKDSARPRQEQNATRSARPQERQADVQPGQTPDQKPDQGAEPRVQTEQSQPPDTQASLPAEQAPVTEAVTELAQDRDSNATEVAQAQHNQNSSTQRAALPVWRQGTQTQPAAPAEQARSDGADTGSQPLRLFRSAAFRGNFNALPKWKRILSKVRGEIETLSSCTSAKTCPPGATSWQRIMKQARGKERMEQLKMINSFFNKWPYRLDQDAYGVSDWWATPQEFLKISGDCEDYAIIKYFALRELGFSQDELRIVVLKDRIRGIAHAVLAVFTHGDAYILNNISDAIFTHDKYRHYVPQYSLNEEHRWSHIPVAN